MQVIKYAVIYLYANPEYEMQKPIVLTKVLIFKQVSIIWLSINIKGFWIQSNRLEIIIIIRLNWFMEKVRIERIKTVLINLKEDERKSNKKIKSFFRDE